MFSCNSLFPYRADNVTEIMTVFNVMLSDITAKSNFNDLISHIVTQRFVYVFLSVK